MKRRYGHEAIIMASLMKKEAAYGTAPAVSAANYRKLKGFVHTVSPEDVVSNDLEEHTGSEAATSQEITENRAKLTLEFPRARPDVIAGFAALTCGSISSSQEGAYTSYKHRILPCSVSTALVSIGLYVNPANRQDGYAGVKGSSFEISCEENGYWKFIAELITSGELTESSETFQSVLSEVLLRAAKTKVYIKTSPDPATDFIATGSVSQTTDNISSGQSLTDLGAEVISWKFKHNNNPDEQAGMGGDGNLQDVDFGRRSWELSMTFRYKDETRRDYFTGLTYVAVEMNCNSGTLVDAAGANKYGAILRIPKCYIKQRPVPQGGPNDPYTEELVFEVVDDGTNPIFDLHVYNAEDEYLAT